VKCLHTIVPALFLAAATVAAQTPQSNGKPTEKVVIQYEKFVENGAFLTPEGWKTAGKLYDRSDAFPRDGTIFLMSTGGSLGEIWVKDSRAEVETKWTDYFGTIDSSLRYEPPKSDIHLAMTAYVFHLVYTNKHRDIGTSGETIREITGPWEWKIEDPQIKRWTTVDRAIAYVSTIRDNTDDPLLKKNADKTIAALRRLKSGCGSASAC
jgi:hypothetical protein